MSDGDGGVEEHQRPFSRTSTSLRFPSLYPELPLNDSFASSTEGKEDVQLRTSSSSVDFIKTPEEVEYEHHQQPLGFKELRPVAVQKTADDEDIPEEPEIFGSDVVQLTETLPFVEGLGELVLNISMDRIHRLYEHCRFLDSHRKGLLAANDLLKALVQVIPNAQFPSSPWRSCVKRLAPNNEKIPYGKFLRLVTKQKMGRLEREGGGPAISDLLQAQKRLMPTSYSTPLLLSRSLPSGQALQERGRAQVMLEIELVTARQALNLERLRMATTQTKITQEEFLLIIDLHGFETHFRPFLSRLVSSFTTRDGLFHFGAFAGCLENMAPGVIGSVKAPTTAAPWAQTPLAPITSVEKREPVKEEKSWKEWETYYLENNEEE